MANNPVSYKIHVDRDTRKAVLDATEKQIEVALKMVGSIAEANASEYCPVETGFLRNSITYALDGEAPKKTTYKADSADKSGKIKTGSYSGEADKEPNGKRSVIIGSNLPYARKMEFGGSKVKAPNGYLRIAITGHLDQYKNAIASALKQIKDAGK